jgi:DNA-binding CsgD family transcriptional regulator
MNRQSAHVFVETMLELKRATTLRVARSVARLGVKRLQALGAPTTSELCEIVRQYRDDRLCWHADRSARGATGGGDFRLLQAKGLTRRECEVLHWLGDGKRDRDIATILGIAVRTVRKHVEHIRTKLHVETRMAAVAAARHVVSRQR